MTCPKSVRFHCRSALWFTKSVISFQHFHTHFALCSNNYELHFCVILQYFASKKILTNQGGRKMTWSRGAIIPGSWGGDALLIIVVALIASYHENIFSRVLVQPPKSRGATALFQPLSYPLQISRGTDWSCCASGIDFSAYFSIFVAIQASDLSVKTHTS